MRKIGPKLSRRAFKDKTVSAHKHFCIAESIRSARKIALKEYLDKRKIAASSHLSQPVAKKAFSRMNELSKIIIQYDLLLTGADIESEASFD